MYGSFCPRRGATRTLATRPQGPGFTLVELLVVIGIIAVLIGILLPGLAAARRQANATKCLTQLREIGNSFQYYAIESKGYFPPAQLRMADGVTYNLYGTEFTMNPNGVYWFNFLNKFVSKAKIGTEDNNGSEIGHTRTRSIFWGCPSWEGYNDDNQTAGLNRLQTGYGMNGYPSFTYNYPRAGSSGPIATPTAAAKPPAKEWSYNDRDSATLWSKTTNREIPFTKQKMWGKNGAERCLVADSRFWLVDSGTIPNSGVIPVQSVEANVNGAAGETTISMWRHGKPPKTVLSGTVQKFPISGKFAYNILYCDGHVATVSEPKEAYKSVRMKFPG